MTQTRRKLLEHFDDEVREKLKVRDEASKVVLRQFEQRLIELTHHELNGHAHFVSNAAFELIQSPFPGDIPLGRYELPRRSGAAHTYRLNHPLAEAILEQAKRRPLPPAELHFSYDDHEGKITILEPLRGLRGYLALSHFTVTALDQAEDYLLIAAVTDDGQLLDYEHAQRLLTLPAHVVGPFNGVLPPALDMQTQQKQASIQRRISQRNAQFFEAEAAKLDSWADDLKIGLEREIKELDRQIKEARRAATAALTLEEKLAGQKQVKALESQRNQKRRSLFDAQDRVDSEREALIASIEGKLTQQATISRLFNIRWHLR